MSKPTAKELYDSWNALVKHKNHMGEKLLELIAHPDCTPAHLAEAMPRYQATVEMLRKHKPTMLDALRTKYSLYEGGHFADYIARTKL